MKNKINISDSDIERVCHESLTMAQAATKLGLHFNTFKRRAIAIGCYKPNPGGKGLNKRDNNKYEEKTFAILNGEYPEYQTEKLKLRLFEMHLKENVCEICGQGAVWNGKQLTLELHHKDGNSHNHALENLIIVCPNCHAQTENFRAKNI